MNTSNTESFLKGKYFPGLPSPVRRVEKQGDTRVITDSRGNTLKVTKKKLLGAFNQVLAYHQKVETLKTVRTLPNYRATVMLGGRLKGERKTYSSKENAFRAVDRRYNLAKEYERKLKEQIRQRRG
jgi:hypothetical protein